MRAALAVLLVLAMATPSGAGLFRWTAPDDAIHYTSDPESIPEKYRAAAVDVGAPAPNPTPPAPPVPAGTGPPFGGGGPGGGQGRPNGGALRLLPDTGADRTVRTPAA